MGQPALGFALGKLQTADVLQTSSVLAHLLVDDQLHTPANRARETVSTSCCNQASQPWHSNSSIKQDVRCCFANVLHAQQRVDGVVAAQDAGGEDDRQGVGRHPVGLLLQGDPEARRGRNSSVLIPTSSLVVVIGHMIGWLL